MCRRTLVVTTLLAVLSVIFTPLFSIAASVVVDFETIPGGTPADGLVISDQFSGAIFSIEGGGSPVLAEVGGKITAFFGPPQQTLYDTIAPGADAGQFFLTDDGLIGQPPKVIVITFLTPVASVGGKLLDVDGGDVWTAEARDINGNVIASQTISDGDPDTGDGSATPFLIQHSTNDIASVRFPYSGAMPNVGFGFDDLTAATVVGAVPLPLPPAVWTAISLLGGIWTVGAVRRYRTRPSRG